jgi:hypothetical protein
MIDRQPTLEKCVKIDQALRLDMGLEAKKVRITK